MPNEHVHAVARGLICSVIAGGGLALLVASAGCSAQPLTVSAAETTLRIGVGSLPLTTPQAGLRQVIAALSLEALAAPDQDGRMLPSLAEGWTVAPDGLSVDIRLRSNAKYHDGTPVTSALVAQSLRKDLPSPMGPAFDEDIDRLEPLDTRTLRIVLRRPSRFVMEALDTPIQEPGKRGIGTGPYVASPNTVGELRVNPDHYRGATEIGRITITPYPSVRAAWAELLRGNIDMLYEVNIDSLDSLEASSDISVFSYLRHYQYMILFGPHAASLGSAEVRRELNAAIDREALVAVGLNGRGVPSIGPIPPQHWALQKNAPRLRFDSSAASRLAAKHVRFTCLVPADSAYERVALAVKQQLAEASVDMEVQEASQEQILQATHHGDYEAVLLDPISGPTVFRSFRAFYTRVPFNPKPRGSGVIDAALDRIRYSRSDDEYRAGVNAFQQAIIDDPPALFLAWGQRARAVSRRFGVPTPKPGRDVLSTLELWRPAMTQQLASRN